MAYRLACELPEEVAAIAVLAGSDRTVDGGVPVDPHPYRSSTCTAPRTR